MGGFVVVCGRVGLCVFLLLFVFAGFLMFWAFDSCFYGCFVEKSGIIYLFFEKKVEKVL